MLANFFGKSKPVNFIIITVLFLGYFILNHFQQEIEVYNAAFLLEESACLFLFFGMFFLYNFIITKNRLTKDDSYAFLFFVLVLGANSTFFIGFRMLIVNIFLLLFFRKIYSLRTYKSVLQKLFDAGFWLGICFLFEPFSIVFYLVLLVAVSLFLEISKRTILIPILGFATPVFIYFTYYFLTDSLAVFEKLFEFSPTFNFQLYNTIPNHLILGLLLVFVIVSILIKTGHIFAVSNQFKRSWALLILHLLVSVVFVAFIKEKDGSELMIVFIPATIIIANWIASVEKKWLISAVLLLFFAASLAVHFII
jgi:hypothetical protein